MKEGSPISDSSIDLEQEQQRRRQRSLKQACLVARIADEYKGRDILVLDLTGITPIVDYFVLATGTSRRQMHAVVEEVDRLLASLGSQRLGVEGYESSTWILQDYGDVVLHVFTPEARKLYDLEHLWADAPRVDWQAHLDDEAPRSERA
ncbi:MAG TPA: ribosome silencing factor [Planctomycetaceae bacterium]|nr:ribosome silencing factor [Planctomycetaceae bacterium]HIQ21155.1 ribosome silencing factor [Planctomycetota bacterium]